MNCICCLSKQIIKNPIGRSNYFICQVCGFIFQNGEISRGDQKNIVDHYQDNDPHNAVAISKRGFFEMAIIYLSNKISQSNRSILDIGCGYGYFLETARKKDWETRGVEITAKAANAAQKEFGKEKIFCGQLKHANYPDYSFNVITLWDVLFVVKNPADELMECHRILKPGGIIGIRVRNALFQRFACYAFRPFKKIASKFGFKDPSVFHPYSFSSRSIDSLLTRLGFTNIQIINSSLTTGDPYEHAELKSIVRIFKHCISFFSKLIYFLSDSKWIVGPSLLIWAEKAK